MCKVMEDLIDSEKKEIALRMLDDGTLPLEKIALYAGLSVEEVKALEENRITV